MLSNAETRSRSLTEKREVSPGAGSFVARKVWLPKVIYVSLPYFYLVAGIVAFLATLYISNWLWVLPHYMLFSAACLHLGVLVLRKRRRPREPVEMPGPDTD
jgi:Flp pilus assembly protein TadB